MCLFGSQGLHTLLSMKTGCYIQSICSRFGVQQGSCGNCTLCCVPTGKNDQGNPSKRLKAGPRQPLQPIDDAAAAAQAQALKDQTTQANALRVLSFLRHKCIACRKSSCDGECGNECFSCGSTTHGTRDCSVDRKALVRGKGACWGCMDLYVRVGKSTDHVPGQVDIRCCPLQRRLRKLLFWKHQRILKKESAYSFERFMGYVYSSEKNFFKTVASVSPLLEKF